MQNHRKIKIPPPRLSGTREYINFSNYFCRRFGLNNMLHIGAFIQHWISMIPHTFSRWGNMGSDSAGECGVPMHHRFRMPTTGHGIWWFSWNYGLVHYITMSTEHDWTKGSPQVIEVMLLLHQVFLINILLCDKHIFRYLS